MKSLAFKNVWSRKTRSLLTVLGILVAIQLYVIMSSIMASFDRDIQKQVSGMAGRVIVQYKGEEGVSFPPLNSVIEEKEADAILALPEIDRARSSTVLMQTLVPPPGPNMPPTVLAVGIQPGHEAAFVGESEVAGSNKLEGTHDAILGSAAAKYYNATIGDTIEIRGNKFTVVGTLAETNRLVDGSALLPQAISQNIFVRPGLVSAVLLTAAKADQAVPLAKSIEDTHGKLIAATSADIAKSAEQLLTTQRAFFAMIDNTALVIAAVVVTIVMVMSVNERKKEIGTLKAIGASRKRILGMILTESLILSIAGGIIALPVSIGVDWMMFANWHFNPAEWLTTVGIAAAVGVLAGLWPAWAAQRVNPLESMKYE